MITCFLLIWTLCGVFSVIIVHFLNNYDMPVDNVLVGRDAFFNYFNYFICFLCGIGSFLFVLKGLYSELSYKRKQYEEINRQSSSLE